MLVKSLIVIPTALIGIGLSYWVLLSNKKLRSNRLLFIDINVIVLSLLSDYLSNFAESSVAVYLIRLSYALLLLSVVIFYAFVQHFPFENKRNSTWLDTTLVLSVSLFSVLVLYSPYIVAESGGISGQVSLGGHVSIYYSVLVGLIFVSFINLLNKYRQSMKVDKIKIRLMIVGIFFYISIQLFFNLLMPSIGIHNLYYLGDY
jgi:hypothetical protein